MLATFSLARAAARRSALKSNLVSRQLARPASLTAIRLYAQQSQPSDSSKATPSPDQVEEQPKPSEADLKDKNALTGDGSLAASFFDMPGQGGSEAGRGGRAGYRAMSSIEKRRRNMSRLLALLGLVGVSVGAWNLSRPFDGESWEDRRLASQLRIEMGLTAEQDLPDGLSGRFHRCKTRVSDLMDFLNKPAWDPLLPPPLPPTHQRPYTLVIELDDLLVHSEWSRDQGWRTAKRPGIEEFLGYLSQFYEIVIFTEAPHYTAMPLLDKIDPLQYYFVYRLFRDSTRYYNRALVKDLSYLGRDLSKVIMLDNEKDHTQLQPENSIVVPRWKGSAQDTSLAAYLPFLEAIGINNVPDVRTLIKAYEGRDIPSAFAERQAEYKQKHVEEWEKRKRENPLTGFSIGSFFGLSSSSSKSDEPPPTFFEQERKKHMELYQQEKNFFKANEAKMLETMEEDRQRQMKEMGSSFLGFVQNMGQGNIPKPPDHEQPGTAPQQQPSGAR